MRWLIVCFVLEHISVIVLPIFIIGLLELSSYASVNTYIETSCYLDGSPEFAEIDQIGFGYYGKIQMYVIISSIRYDVLIQYPATPVWIIPKTYQTICNRILDVNNNTHCYISLDDSFHSLNDGVFEKPDLWIGILSIIISMLWLFVIACFICYYIFEKKEQLKVWINNFMDGRKTNMMID